MLRRLRKPTKPFFPKRFPSELTVEALEDRCLLSTFTWIRRNDAGAGSWNDQNNWIDQNGANGIPGARDSAVVSPQIRNNVQVGNTPIQVNVQATVQQLGIIGTFTSTLSVLQNQSLTINGTVNGITMNSNINTGTLSGPGSFTVQNCTLTLNGGTIQGFAPINGVTTFEIAPSATMALNVAGNIVISGSQVTDAGTLNVVQNGNTSNPIQLQNGSILSMTVGQGANNNPAMNVQTTATIQNTDNSNCLVSIGANTLLNIQNGASYLDVQSAFQSGGQINVQAGDLRLSRGSTIQGDGGVTNGYVNMTQGTTVLFLGQVTLNAATLQGGGQAKFGQQGSYPTITLVNTVYVQNVRDWSSSLGGAGNMVIASGGTYVEDAVQWLGGAQTSIQVQAGATLKLYAQGISIQRQVLNNGSIILLPTGDPNRNRDVVVQNGGTIDNRGGSVFDIQCDLGINALNGGNFLVRPNATLQKTVGSETSNIRVNNFNNQGTMLQRSGFIAFPQPAAQNQGMIQIQAGGIDWLAGLLQTGDQSTIAVAAGADMTVTGTLEEDAGTVTIDGSTEVSGPYSEVGGTLTVDVGSALSVTSGLTIGSSATLVSGAGAVTVTANVTNGGQLDVGGLGSFGTLTISGDFTQGSGASLNMDVFGPGGGGGGTGAPVRGRSALGPSGSEQNDHLTVTGLATLGGTLTIYTTSAGPGDSWDLIDWGSRSGTFLNVLVPALSSGSWYYQYDFPSGHFTLGVM
jgi:hypothetical protein